jgi:hypothetical protein
MHLEQRGSVQRAEKALYIYRLWKTPKTDTGRGNLARIVEIEAVFE